MPFLAPAKFENRRIHIIGQGLAGSILAYSLDQMGYDVVIIDDGRLSSSSKVAAGMWNPISFKNLHESWLAHLVLPAAEFFYRNLEKKFSIEVFHALELIRVFPDVHSANDWDQRSLHPELKAFITEKQDHDFAKEFHQPFGHGIATQAGWLHVLNTLDVIRDHFISKKKLHIQSLTSDDEKKLIADGQIVIQCTGAKIIQDAILNWIPVTPNKGQVLTIRIPDLKTQRMINFGKFIVPLGKDIYKLGATFELFPEHIHPTEQGKLELLEDFLKISKSRFEVLEHLAGYRPTVPDRIPVMGMDPENPLKGMFNGFGSKGVMMIPFFATHFIKHLTEDTPLMKEVNLIRFAKRYKLDVRNIG